MAKKGKKKSWKKKGPNKSNVSPTCWSINSPLYKEFAELCEKKGWHERDSAPRRGSNEAKELDKIIEKGLGNGKPLSRAQINRKFEHWKKSNESEKKILRLDESKIENEHELLKRMKETDYWIVTVMNERLCMFDSQSPTYAESISGWLALPLGTLRTNLIDAFNELLSDSSASKRYNMLEEELLSQFQDDFLGCLTNHDNVKPLLDAENDSNRNIRERAAGIAMNISRLFVEEIVMAIKRGGHGNETMLKAITDLIQEFEEKECNLRDNNRVRRALHNLAGWLIKAARHPNW